MIIHTIRYSLIQCYCSLYMAMCSYNIMICNVWWVSLCRELS